MCLAIPGEIVELTELGGDALRAGRVSFAGVVKDVCLVYVPEAGVGDFVLVHAGFAIAQVSESHARETLTYVATLAEPEARRSERAGPESSRRNGDAAGEGPRPSREIDEL
jgi:hydrogenase expression/formation protein HypC